ncbi:TPA: hypothetical protein N0F65_006270 [Lagenidium giganteum]|uniref:Calmodulin n=1 Tax=Lagenidium giganteum TaxID=4803 RepID=A0AAV2Z626_9STRA|nr:TPA: hypothetical protein N0F65_006270 [Lagenidium giganteum]
MGISHERLLAETPKLTNYQRALLRKTFTKTGVLVVDRMLENFESLFLSFDDFEAISRAAPATARRLLTPQVFLMVSIASTRMVTLDAAQEDFVDYYVLICTRRLLLPHDFKKAQGKLSIDDLSECKVLHTFLQLTDSQVANWFAVDTNVFHPTTARYVHRQYVQLDRDKNGMISADEMLEYGKKRAFNPEAQRPTYDLTSVFVRQVFSEVITFAPHDELDYKGYIDFTLLMMDKSSLASLRFFWNVLDFRKQGFLDAFSLDFFLRDLVLKIREHDEDERVDPTRLRTEIFDLVAPRHPLRITWEDLKQCKLAHSVVRLLVDYVTFRAYEDAGGHF